MNYDDLVRRLKEEMFCYCVSPYLTGTANWKRCAVCQAIDAIQELQKDAMRYRWLKANHLQTGTDSWIRTGDDLEEAIDEAMQHEA